MKEFFKKLFQKSSDYLDAREIELVGLWRKISADRVKKNRFLVLFISLLLIFDYLVFCLHAGKNIFDIFPSFPVLDSREERIIYLPDTDGKTIFEERRKIEITDDNDELVRLLFKIVVKGSLFENTAMAAPLDTYVRKVWFCGDQCVIDVGLSTLPDTFNVLPGSEENFRRALEKTITENIPSVKTVLLLERGIPNKNLWEIASQSTQINPPTPPEKPQQPVQ